ncbi:MAG: FAS1-like dehydratase domain-containing protein [Gammaproteobacteria bacterium]
MVAKKFPVEAGQILLFARSLADANTAYVQGDAAGDVSAPPTFVQSSAQYDPDYPLRPKIGKTWFGSGKHPTGIEASSSASGGSSSSGSNAGVLHAEQHYTYHHPLKAGVTLTAEEKPGKTWEKTGKRAGKLVFAEAITEYRDASGKLIVTARSVGVRTEKVIEQ